MLALVPPTRGHFTDKSRSICLRNHRNREDGEAMVLDRIGSAMICLITMLVRFGIDCVPSLI